MKIGLKIRWALRTLRCMSDIVKLLPDSIANQIAAGEVIQRPASVVKELLENSIDAGANNIELIVKDSGKSLIQVVDDGRGMSETDARMSLERHATSKIEKSEDLFHIKTMGFRGEALASVVAVAQIDVKTRSAQRDVGTHIIAEASEVKHQEMCATPVGTTIAVKNLFFNVPARRKFLKSDGVELRHIIDEFQRVALVNPQVQFKMYHNDQQLFLLPKSNVRQRVIGILGKGYNEKLVPIEEATDLCKITGFIGKPEAARKSRGEQFFFVNNRYFKSPYFHSSVQKAFEGLVPHGHHPSYFIYFEVDPSSIDVNIHPTKTEIKFEDERSIYAILLSAVKRSIGQYHVSPSIDFERETAFDILPPKAGTEVEKPGIMVNPSYNPFDDPQQQQKNWSQGQSFQKPITENWESVYEGLIEEKEDEASGALPLEDATGAFVVRQIGNRYILVQSDDGIFLVHQYRAHARVLFEAFEESVMDSDRPVQQLLFPHQLNLSNQDAALLSTAMEPLNHIGFEIAPFGQNDFIIQGIPAACPNLNVENCMAGFIDDLRENKPGGAVQLQQQVIRSMAQQAAIRSGQQMKAQEMIALFQALMQCKMPQVDLNGKQTFVLLNTGNLDKLFSA